MLNALGTAASSVVGAASWIVGTGGARAGSDEAGVVLHQNAFVCPCCLAVLPNMSALVAHHERCSLVSMVRHCAWCSGTVESGAAGSEEACSARVSGREVSFCGPRCWADWLQHRAATAAATSRSAAVSTAPAAEPPPQPPAAPPSLSASASFDSWYQSQFEDEVAEVAAAGHEMSVQVEDRTVSQEAPATCPCDMCGSPAPAEDAPHAASMMAAEFRFCSAQCWHEWASGGFVGCNGVSAMSLGTMDAGGSVASVTAAASPAEGRRGSTAAGADGWGFFESDGDGKEGDEYAYGASPPTPTPTSSMVGTHIAAGSGEEGDAASAGEARALLSRFGSFMGRLDGAVAAAEEGTCDPVRVSTPRTNEAASAAFVEGAASELAQEAELDLGNTIAAAIAGIEDLGLRPRPLQLQSPRD